MPALVVALDNIGQRAEEFDLDFEAHDFRNLMFMFAHPVAPASRFPRAIRKTSVVVVIAPAVRSRHRYDVHLFRLVVRLNWPGGVR